MIIYPPSFALPSNVRVHRLPTAVRCNGWLGGRALIAELKWRTGLRCVGGQERAAEREGVLGRSFGAEKLQLGDRLGYVWAMPSWDPPQNHPRFSHPLKPLLAAAHD